MGVANRVPRKAACAQSRAVIDDPRAAHRRERSVGRCVGRCYAFDSLECHYDVRHVSHGGETRRLSSRAAVASIGLHAGVVALLLKWPEPILSASAPALKRSTQRVASERLIFVGPRPSAMVGKPGYRRRNVSPAPAAPSFAPPLEGNAESTAAGAHDSMAAVESPKRDSVLAPSGVYERPVHPALRGLVPTWNGGVGWGGISAVASRSAPLAPRPPECVRGVPGYFACSRRLFAWRNDSIYHVRVQCRRDSSDYRKILPPDCDRFRPDSAR